MFVLLIGLNAEEQNLLLLNPSNTVVAFDFHGVLVDTDYKSIYQLIDYNFGKQVAYALPSILLKLPWWLSAIFTLKKKYPSGALFPELAKEYSFFQPLVPTILRMTNQQKINEQHVALLKQLHDAQYSLVLASNMTQDTMADLRQNGSKELNEVINQFNDFLIPNKENNLLHKPDPAYFEKLKGMFSDKQIVFFDDKFINRSIAQKRGILAFEPRQVQPVAETLLQNAQKSS